MVQKQLQSVISISCKVHVVLKRLCCHPRDIEALMCQGLDSPLGQGCPVERVCLNAISVVSLGSDEGSAWRDGGCELACGQFHLRHMCGDDAYDGI